MKKIDKLTPKQRKAMIPYSDKWIEQGLKTGETDWDTFDKYMPICYEKAGLKYPKNVVRVKSPLVGALASSISEAILRRGDRSVRNNVGSDAGKAVNNAIFNAVDSAVGYAVSDTVNKAIGDNVGKAIRSTVGGAVDYAVDDAVSNAVADAVGGVVGDNISKAVNNAIFNTVDGSVGYAISHAVNDAVSSAVNNAVDDAVSNAVDNAVGGVVNSAVNNAVDDAVDDAVRGTIDNVSYAVSIIKKSELNIDWHHWLGGQFGISDWHWGVAFSNFFFDVCKLKLSKDIMERALAYRKVCESVNYIWANSNFVMVCARPIRISRDNQGRLHSTTEKAIEYPDGWGLYMIHGVQFTEEQFKKAKNAKVEEIIAWEDIDQRSALLREAPIEKLLKKVDKKLIDKTEECGGYKLYEIELESIGKACLLAYKSWSSDKTYTKFIPPESDNCLEAVASLRHQTVEELKNSYKS